MVGWSAARIGLVEPTGVREWHATYYHLWNSNFYVFGHSIENGLNQAQRILVQVCCESCTHGGFPILFRVLIPESDDLRKI
jgi:hypothetical protein